MRLGFHYHEPAIQDGGSILMPGPQGRFVDSIAPLCTEVRCLLHSPVASEKAFCSYRIQSGNVRLMDLGPHTSVPRRLLFAWKAVNLIHKDRENLEVMLLRGPSPLLPCLARAAKPLPTVLLLVSDNLGDLGDSAQPQWRKRAIRLWETWNARKHLEVAERSLTFVNSRKLHKAFVGRVANLVETRTSTLTTNDLFVREDTCDSRPFRLLYCGRMATEKGLPELIEAFTTLVLQGADLILDLVGPPERGDDALQRLLASSQQKGLGARIICHGYKPLGPELFSLYRQADIFVLASRNESFPRTVWEAMGQSLPVVVTRVGSVPDYLTHLKHAYLVEPKNAASLAEGIRTLTADSNLRRRLIKHGLELARANTLDQRATEMVSAIRSWLPNQSCA